MRRSGWNAVLLIAVGGCAHAEPAPVLRADAEVLSACISATVWEAARHVFPRSDNALYVTPNEDKDIAFLRDGELRAGFGDAAYWATLRGLFQGLRERTSKSWRPPKHLSVKGLRIKLAAPPTKGDLIQYVDHLYYSFYAPAYAVDGQSSAVYAAVGPIPHGASAACVLSLQDGKWGVAPFPLAQAWAIA